MSDLEQIQTFFERHCARLPDPVGMRVYATHLAAGMSLATLEAAIASSDEARRVAIWRRITGKPRPENDEDRAMLRSVVLPAADALPAPPDPAPAPPEPAATTPSESALFVGSVYLAVLGRRPDEVGLRAYQDAIAHGLPLLQVVKDVLASEESQRMNGALPALAIEQRLRRWARLAPLEGLCTRLADAALALEWLRLWNRRIKRAGG